MDTDQAWREWAEQDPYYAVVSDDAFRGENLQRNLDRFFRSGDQLIASVLEQAKRHGMEPRRYELALDFGCGVGRLSMPLARRFQRVVGIDVSPEMLREAEKNCALFDIKNASFLVSDSALQGVEDQFDFVNSYIVLQHIPPLRGYRLMEVLLSRVRPGGSAMLHFSVKRTDRPLHRLVYRLKHNLPLARYAFNLIQRKAWREPLMQMNEYDIRHVLRIFAAHGMEDVLLTLEMHGKVATVRALGHKA